MGPRKDRLQEIQDQLDILMDELHRLRKQIDGGETRRRIYPFPFERPIADDTAHSDTPRRPAKH